MPRNIIKYSLCASKRLLASIHTLGAFFLLLILPVSLIHGQTPVSFSKSFAPATIGPGSVTTLQFVITNNTSTPIENVSFTDNLPAGVVIATPANASSSCGGILNLTSGGGTIDFDLSRLGGNVTCTISVDVTSSVVGIHQNLTSDLSYDIEGNAGPAQADLTVDAGRPGISMTLTPSSISPGGLSTVSILIDNSANASPATNPNFSLVLPTGVQFAVPLGLSSSCGSLLPSVSGNTLSLSNAGASIAAGSSCTINVNVTAPLGGVFQLKTSELTTTSGATTVSCGFSSAQLASVREFLTKTFIDDPVTPGDQVILEFVLTNLSRSGPATNISFTDDLSSVLNGLEADQVLFNDCGATIDLMTDPTLIDFSGGSINASGETCSCRIALNVPADAVSGTYTNTISDVTYTVAGIEETGNDASDDLIVHLAPLLTKEFVDDPVVPGDPVTLRFTIQNTSLDYSVTAMSFNDIFPSELGFVQAQTPVDGFCGAASQIIFTPLTNPAPPSSSVPASLSITDASLLPGASCMFDVVLTVPVNTPSGVYPNTSSEITGIVNGDPVIGDGASDLLTVVSAPQLTKTFTPSVVAPGNTTVLAFTLVHSQNAVFDAFDIAFTDDLDAALSGLMATQIVANKDCQDLIDISNPSIISYSGGSLLPGESCTCEVEVLVPANADFGTFTNTTSAVAATIDGNNVTGNPASDDLIIPPVSFNKSFTDDPAVPGSVVTLEFDLENISGLELTNLSFTDDLSQVLSGITSSQNFPMLDVCGTGSELTLDGEILTLSGGHLTTGTSCTFSVILNVPDGVDLGIYPNQTSELEGSASGQPFTSPPAADDLVVASESNVLTLIKSFVVDEVSPGDMVDISFDIGFIGTEPSASNISFTDHLNTVIPGWTAIMEVGINSCGATVGLGPVIDVSGSTLASGQSCNIIVRTQLPNNVVAGTYTNTTSAITADKQITGDLASAELIISTNSRPIADAGPDQTVECTGTNGADVTLDGSASQSQEPSLAYSWRKNGMEIATGPMPTVSLSLGVHIITLIVTDASGSDSDEVIITVEDTQAPVITLIGDVEVVRFSGPYMDPQGATTVSDICDPNPSLIIDASNVDTNLPGMYPVFYTATDASGNSSMAQRDIEVIEDPDAPAHPFLLLADQNISVKEVQRLDGAMHANALISVGRGLGGNQGGPTLYSSDMTAVDMITVSRNNNITGDITSPSVSLANNVVVNGTVTEVPVDVVALPPLNFVAGGSDITVPSNGTLDLAPGSYGNLLVQTGATLNLTTGEYFFSIITFHANAFLNVDIPTGPTSLNSVGQILIFEDVEMKMTPLGDGESEYLRIQSLTDIFVKEEAKVLGQLIAPNGQVNLEKDVNFRGAICAKFINITQGGAEVLSHDATGSFSSLIHEVIVDRGEWVIRPNPVRNDLTISGSIPDLRGINQVRIVDLSNRVIFSAPLTSDHVQLEVDTREWTSGFYFVILQLADEVRTFKVVKVE